MNSEVDYEAAMAFVVSLRPRMAVADAHEAAMRLLELCGHESPKDRAIREERWHDVALMTPVVMDLLRAGKKIPAIKELRTATNIGLREAKEAVEHPSVWTADVDAAYTAASRGWSA